MSFNAFMAQNVKLVDSEKEIIVSDRFTNEDGSVAKFKIRTILSGEDAKMRQKCMMRVPVPGRPGLFQDKFDSLAYIRELVVKSLVEPDLANAELQESYGVMGEEALLDKMLTAAEYNVLSEEVQNLNSITPIQESIEEAKN